MRNKLLLLLFVIGMMISSCSKDDQLESVFVEVPDREEPASTITRCVNGMAGDYPCSGYDLMSLIPREDLLGPLYTQEIGYVWGWTDPVTGKEYALVGSSRGVYFIDVSDAVNPVVVGELLSFSVIHTRQIIQVHNNFAYFVSNIDGHGMKVFDLTRLRDLDPSNGPVSLTEDANYNLFGLATRISINSDSNHAYVVGTTSYSGGPVFIDLTDPLNPAPAGGYDDGGIGYSTQVIKYRGPDTDYTGKEIMMGCNEGKVVIVDVTNKSNPQTISSLEYANARLPIEGHFTSDRRYFILGDFWDELGSGINSRTIVLDVQDLDNPKVHNFHFGPTRANDFGGEIKGNILYFANLTAGARMIDLSTVDDSVLTEVGYFYTYPENDSAIGYTGATNIYPHFASGNILISDLRGLFIIRKN